MRADITTEVAPIVGSEKQSEDLVMYLLKEFEDSPEKIWQSNIFGKSLHCLLYTSQRGLFADGIGLCGRHRRLCHHL